MRSESLITIALCSFLLLSACSGTYNAKISAGDVSARQTSSPAGAAGRGNKSPYTVLGKTYEVLPDSHGYLEIGIASWYGKKFHGRLTSNGEVYDMYGLTAAHKALPLPTYVKVTNLDNRRQAILKVNDRGPFHDDRLIDLSYQAAVQLGFSDQGTAPVVVEALDAMNGIEKNPIAVTPMAHEGSSYYLQIGAFANRQSAVTLMAQIKLLMSNKETSNISVKILESEQSAQVLHKVWMGPLGTEIERDALAMLVEEAKLGRPLKVEIN
jgi:rare lipoprotein A